MNLKRIKNELDTFNYITFNEEDHIYTYPEPGSKDLFKKAVQFSISSTKWVEKFKIPFKKDFWANKKAQERGIDKEDVLAEWKAISDASCAKGTDFHLYLEYVMNGDDLKYGNEILKKMALDFHKKYLTGYTSVKNEVIVGDIDLDIAGMVDNVSLGKDGKIYILDWKTNKEIKMKNKWQKMKAPFKHLDDCNFNHYSLQLSLYKYLIEKNTDLVIDGGLKIVHFVETNKTYKVHDCLDLTPLIHKILNS